MVNKQDVTYDQRTEGLPMVKKTHSFGPKELENINAKELEKIIAEAGSELKKRNNIKLARREIQSTLKKYKLSLEDIQTHTSEEASVKLSKSKASKQKADKRAVVSPKYKDPGSSNRWSGRGKAPAWVIDVCKKRGISLSEFKESETFRI